MDNREQKELILINFLILLILYFLAFTMSGCAQAPLVSGSDISQNQKPLDKEIFRNDMQVKVDGVSFYGVGVLPKKQKYEFTIFPKEKSSRVIVQTCHREIVFDQPKPNAWNGRSFTFVFEPIPGVETDRMCMLEIASLNEKTKNGFASFEFEDTRELVSMKAKIKCNGVMSDTKPGVSICQSAQGLDQEISFDEPVVFSDLGCGKVVSDVDGNGMRFRVKSKDGQKCSIYFLNKPGTLAHRMSLVFYTMVPFPSPSGE